MTPFHQYGRRQIDGRPPEAGKEHELAIRAQDRAFQLHLLSRIKDFPQPNPAVSGQERK